MVTFAVNFQIMELIPRPQYIDKIAGLINRGMMLILVGHVV